MEVVDCWLQMHKVGSSTPLLGVTPAESVILREMHEPNVGKPPLFDFSGFRKEPRTDANEFDRLRRKYGAAQYGDGRTWLEKLFPGANPKLPQTFAEVGLDGIAPKEPEPAPTTSAKTPVAAAKP